MVTIKYNKQIFIHSAFTLRYRQRILVTRGEGGGGGQKGSKGSDIYGDRSKLDLAVSTQ